VSEFVPAILWEEATEAGHVWQRRFYDFVVLSESKRIQKLRYMAGWPTCPRVALFNASESRAPAPIGIGGAVAHPPPSRPGELHPGPLTEPVVSLSTYHGSCHPSKTAAFRRDQRAPPVTSWPITIPTRVTCSLRSPAVNPVHRYYGAVRPCLRIVTFRLMGLPLVPFPLASPTRFSSSVRRPGLESRLLYTGHGTARKCQSKHTVDGLNPQPA